MAYLSPWWVKFEGRKAACVEAESKDAAIVQAEKLMADKVVSCEGLPYPAEPRISEEKSSCPAFCFSPEGCAGRGSCPRSYACSE